MRKLRPRATTYLIWDTLQRGLAIRVQPTGSRAWKVIYCRHGRPRWLHLGDAGAIGLADARTLAAEAMLEVARGKDPAAEKRAERGAGTFAELAVKYLETYAKKRNKSWRQADALVQRYLLPKWGKLQAASITRATSAPWWATSRRPCSPIRSWRPPAPSSPGRVKQEIVAANPCRGIDRNATQSRERVLSDSRRYRASGARSTTPVSSPAPP